MTPYIDKLMGGRIRDRELSDAVYNQQIAELRQTITNSQGSRLVSGSVTWIEDLDFLVSPLEYIILGTRVFSDEITVTIPANAVNNPMFAVIYADILGNVSYVAGTPAASPAVPILNDATQLALTVVYIPALGTAPGTDPGGTADAITTEVIYNENTEWTTGKTEESGAAINLAATTAPAVGAKHIGLTISGGAATYERGTLETSGYSSPGINYTIDEDNVTEIVIGLDQIIPDHKSDVTVGTTRHLVYYKILRRLDLTAKLKHQTTGVEYPLSVTRFDREQFTVPAIGFAVEVPDQITLSVNLQTIPQGAYWLILGGFTRYDQQYSITPAVNKTPATAAISFTRAGGEIEAASGKITAQIRTSAAWFNTTGLLFDLYNGAVKIGSRLLAAGQYGFNPSILNEYQTVIIPVADFAPSMSKITKLVIRPVNAWPNGLLYIDNIILQTGISTGSAADKFVESVSLAVVNNALKLQLNRSAGLDPLVALFGTMAGKTFWTGTAAAYAAINPKDSNTIYHIEE